MEIVALVIAIMGFVLSVASWANELWKGRKHLRVNVDFESELGDTFFSSKFLNATVAFSFENKSSNPIAVMYVQLTSKQGICYRAELKKGFVAHRFRTLIDTDTKHYEHFIESAEFPIEIGSYGAAYEYVRFLLPKNLKVECITGIIVITNRGQISIADKDSIEKFRELLEIPVEPLPETPGYTRDHSGSLL